MRSQETEEQREVRCFIFFALAFISVRCVKIFRRAWKLTGSDNVVIGTRKLKKSEKYVTFSLYVVIFLLMDFTFKL